MDGILEGILESYLPILKDNFQEIANKNKCELKDIYITAYFEYGNIVMKNARCVIRIVGNDTFQQDFKI